MLGSDGVESVIGMDGGGVGSGATDLGCVACSVSAFASAVDLTLVVCFGSGSSVFSDFL